MKAVSAGAIRDVLLLSLAAGSADAAGFMGLGRVFTSNMTGNVVLLGIDLGQGQLAPAVRSLFVLAVFAGGVALGVRLGRGVAEKDWPRLASRLIGLEKIALVLFAAGWIALADKSGCAGYVLMTLLSLAMGLQTAALNRLNAPGVATTAITGTLTALVAELVSHVAAKAGESDGSRIRFQAGVILIYLAGAAGCGLLMIQLPWLAGCPPALAALCVWPKTRHE